MEIAYDPAKNAKNIRERGLDFERAREFDFDTAEIRTVAGKGELRYLATGFLGQRIHILCFKYAGAGIRVISFRKANKGDMNKAGAISNEAQDLIEDALIEDERDVDNIWNKGSDLIDDDGEIRELTAEDFTTFEPFNSLPPDLQHTLREINRGNVTFRPDPVEEQIPVPLSRSVVER